MCSRSSGRLCNNLAEYDVLVVSSVLCGDFSQFFIVTYFFGGGLCGVWGMSASQIHCPAFTPERKGDVTIVMLNNIDL